MLRDSATSAQLRARGKSLDLGPHLLVRSGPRTTRLPALPHLRGIPPFRSDPAQSRARHRGVAVLLRNSPWSSVEDRKREMVSPTSAPRQPRFQIVVPLRYRQMLGQRGERQASSGFSYDLSLSGAAIDLPQHLPIRNRVSLDFLLGPESLELNGGVLWVRRPVPDLSVYRHGIAFAPLDGTEYAQLNRFLLENVALPTRTPLPPSVKAVVQATIEARVVDLSAGGACLEHRGMLRPQSACQLLLVDPLQSLRICASIVRCQAIGVDGRPGAEGQLLYQTAVVFRDLSRPEDAAIRQMIMRYRHTGVRPGHGQEG